MKHPRFLATCLALTGAATLSSCNRGAQASPAASADAPVPAAAAPAPAAESTASAAPVAAAPAPEPAKTSVAGSPFNDNQLLEEIGWIVAKRVGLPDYQFSAAEQDFLVQGYKESLGGKESPFDSQKIQPFLVSFMQTRQQSLMERMKTENMAAEKAFFAKLKVDKPSAVFLPDGLAYEIVKPGTGVFPKAEDTVSVKYTGSLLDGKVFDSSDRHGGSSEFPLNQVIRGWTEGLQKVNVGGKIKLYIPSELGYGDHGSQGIPPSSTLVFDVELLSVTRHSAAAPSPAFHITTGSTVPSIQVAPAAKPAAPASSPAK